MVDTPTLGGEIRILQLQSAEDASVCLRKLQAAGMSVRAFPTEDAEEFKERLDTECYHVILAASRVGGWGAREVLSWMAAKQFGTPLVAITSAVQEAAAPDFTLAGAAAQVSLLELERLPLAVWRAVAERDRRLEHERSEREWRESEEQYRLLFDSNPNPMWVCDAENFRFLAVNDAAIEHYGYSRTDFLSMTVADVHPEEVPFLERQSVGGNVYVSSGSGEVWKHVKKNGVTIDVEISSQPIVFRGQRAFLVLAHDITALLYAEDALRESREQLQLLLDSSAEAIFGLDLSGACTFSNAAAVRMLGYPSAATLLGKDMHSLIHAKRADGTPYPRSECPVLKTVAEGLSTHLDTEVFLRADGTTFPVEYWSHPVVRDGDAVGSVVTFFDISEKKKAEEALRRTEAKYTSIFNGAPYGIYRVDSDDRLLMANPAFVRLLGYETEADLLRVQSSSALYGRAEDCVCKREKYSRGRDTVDVETTLKRKDGGHLNVRLHGRQLRSQQEETGYEVFVENITEQRHLERQLLQSQKMEAIGQLAGGVAHDFNNLLMVINSFAQLILHSSDDAQKVRHYAGQINEAGTKAASVTKQLLAFSRNQVQDLRILDLNTIVGNWSGMLPRLLGEEVEMIVSSPSQPALVYADQGQIDQVIMNLVLNARDAMQKGGRITIATDRVHLDQTYFDAHDVRIAPGNYVMLSVTDNGCGMDEATKARVFEPFFTTKARDKGTGLGLATVYGIVKQSSGFVWVYSELGEGTAFKVYLPEAVGKVPVAQKQSTVADEPEGSETVLIVEDETGIRDVTSCYLRTKGYRVLQASNPAEALHVFAEGKEPIDLILTDMIMPGGSGPELAATLRNMGHPAPVIFMSGYADRAVSIETLKDSQFLQKPFSLAKLARTVRTALEKKSAQSVKAE